MGSSPPGGPVEPAASLLPVVPPGELELPFDFGPPMESEQHRQNMTLLIDALRLHLADRQDVYVAGNMALYFNELQVRKNDFLGPDVFVVLDTVNRPRRSWVVWQEGQTPDVVIELLSASTEDNDRGKKKQTYARSLHVPEYYLYDPLDGRFEGPSGTVDDRLMAGLALAIAPLRDIAGLETFEACFELRHWTPTERPCNTEDVSPIEATGAVRYGGTLFGLLAAGGRLNHGLGAPDARIEAAVGVTF